MTKEASTEGQIYDKEMAKAYGLHTPDENGTEGNMNKALQEALPQDLRGMKIVDAGCGQGRWVPLFMERGATNVIGVDSSKDQLNKIPENIRMQISVKLGGLKQTLPKLGPRADIGWACFSVCCFPHPEEPIEAIHATLKQNGTMIMATNVFVPNEIADQITEHDRPVPVDILEHTSQQRHPIGGKMFRHVLEDGNVNLEDFIHTLGDYSHALSEQKWNITDARIFLPQGISYCGSDDDLAEKEGLQYRKLCVVAIKK